jgi:hypothetical protein
MAEICKNSGESLIARMELRWRREDRQLSRASVKVLMIASKKHAAGAGVAAYDFIKRHPGSSRPASPDGSHGP